MIALLSDFQETAYAGVVKAVIYSENPKANIVDIQHNILPQNILQAAWILKTSYLFFPKKTIFVCVVDPGVGGKRKNIAIETKNYWFIGPNNGCLYEAIKQDEIKQVYEIIIKNNWLVSNTFHGRDIYAKVAGQIDQGNKKALKKIPEQELERLEFFQKEHTGQIVNIDGYGNIITNVPTLNKKEYKVSYDGMEALIDFHKKYESAEEELFLITGSNNTLEFSIKNGSALNKFEVILAKAEIGKKIKIE
ncbi:MAG: SAM-dependent chlorinase/fluorinase [Candidatus Diapherotrites archaeon]|nr:SAM-dependent chlorinase/fluorinase [Candidatus Diapherotrites archaeon]